MGYSHLNMTQVQRTIQQQPSQFTQPQTNKIHQNQSSINQDTCHPQLAEAPLILLLTPHRGWRMRRMSQAIQSSTILMCHPKLAEASPVLLLTPHRGWRPGRKS